MCLVVVINVIDGYNNFPYYSEKIPSLSCNLCTEQRNRRHLGCILQSSHSALSSQMKANRYTCYNASTIFDSISCKLCERKTLVMAENSQKPLPYFFKWRKQCEDESDKESKTTQVAHEDLNDVDDPTKEIAVKAKRKFQPWWLKKQPVAGLWSRKQHHEVQFMWVGLVNIIS